MIAAIESPLDPLSQSRKKPKKSRKDTSRRRNRPRPCSRPAPEVADIFHNHGPVWRHANAGHVSLDQMKVRRRSADHRHNGMRSSFCREVGNVNNGFGSSSASERQTRR